MIPGNVSFLITNIKAFCKVFNIHVCKHYEFSAPLYFSGTSENSCFDILEFCN